MGGDVLDPDYSGDVLFPDGASIDNSIYLPHETEKASLFIKKNDLTVMSDYFSSRKIKE